MWHNGTSTTERHDINVTASLKGLVLIHSKAHTTNSQIHKITINSIIVEHLNLANTQSGTSYTSLPCALTIYVRGQSYAHV